MSETRVQQQMKQGRNPVADASDQNERNSYLVEINGDRYEVTFVGENGSVIIDGEAGFIDMREKSVRDHYSMIVGRDPDQLGGDSLILGVEASSDPNAYRAHAGGYDFDVEVLSAREAYLREYLRAAGVGRREGRVNAPMPGLIIKVEMAEGEQVEAGQGLIVMEAMKMENEIKAPVAGRVTALKVSEGEAVNKGQLLFEIEPEEA